MFFHLLTIYLQILISTNLEEYLKILKFFILIIKLSQFIILIIKLIFQL